MNRLLVIGGASSDVLHLEDRTIACAGGAGMYTAMAARRCGAQTALFGPRPEPCPEPWQGRCRERCTEFCPEPCPEHCSEHCPELCPEPCPELCPEQNPKFWARENVTEMSAFMLTFFGSKNVGQGSGQKLGLPICNLCDRYEMRGNARGGFGKGNGNDGFNGGTAGPRGGGVAPRAGTQHPGGPNKTTQTQSSKRGGAGVGGEARRGRLVERGMVTGRGTRENGGCEGGVREDGGHEG